MAQTPVRPRRRPDASHAAALSPQFSAGEFFAGIGLVRLALELSGFRVVFANDIDPDKRELYEQNFDAADFHLGDVHKIDADALPDCDLFTASFPCNDLSVAGAMKGLNAGQSSAFWGFVDVVRGMGDRRPRVIMLENVPGFLMSNEGRDFGRALGSLNELGYAVDAFLIDAARFVPQSRLRLFVVAKRDAPGCQVDEVEVAWNRPKALVNFMRSHPQLRWNVADWPEPPPRTTALLDIVEDLPDDHPAWWNEERTRYFMSQMSDRHRETAETMINAEEVGYGTAFRRVRHGRSMAELRVDGIAGCLRTPRGGSGRQILFKAGGGRHQVRLLTARECARLQGVADSYRIGVPLNQALFGFGDAVCVPVVAWIARHYLRACLSDATPERNP